MASKIVCIFVLLSSFSSLVFSAPVVKTLEVPTGGPESLAFDASGGLYTGVNDGYVLKYADGEWTAFGYAAPNWSSECVQNYAEMPLECGRVLGLGVHQKSQTFYLADAYHGLHAVGPQGGRSTQVSSQVNGIPLIWLDGLVVDQNTGFVYFTEASTVYNFSDFMGHLSSGDSTGRANEYNPHTGKTRNLLSGMRGPGGIGVSNDSSYVLISEYPGNKITKYWLTGPQKDTSELILEPTGPANIILTPAGDFWVACTINGSTAGIRIDGDGNILEELVFGEPYNGIAAQEVHPYGDLFYITSFQSSFIGIYDPFKSKIMSE